MEAENFAIVLLVLGFIAAGGMSAMIWAYQGGGSVSVLFWEVIPTPTNLKPEVLDRFRSGVSAYCSGNYRRAADEFGRVIQTQPNLAQAHHNRGLAFANLRQDDNATRALVKAAELYLELGDKASADLVKQHLSALRARKLARDRSVA